MLIGNLRSQLSDTMRFYGVPVFMERTNETVRVNRFEVVETWIITINVK